MSQGQSEASPPPLGIFVPVPTFFKASDSSLDLNTQTAHAVYLARAGITGLAVLGSTGEAVHLHRKERSRVLVAVRQALVDAGFVDYPLMVGTAAQNVDEVVEQLTEAHDALGPTSLWGLCLAPGYFAASTSQEGIVRWFKAVADRSPIPILVYHYPAVSNNVRVEAATYETLAQHRNIVGCKLSHGDVSLHTQVAANPAIPASHFRCFTGLGQQLLPVVAVGFSGAIDGSAGFFPRTLLRLYQLAAAAQLTEEELVERRLLQFRVSRMEELVVRHGTVGIKEAIRRLRSLGDGDAKATGPDAPRAVTRPPLSFGLPGGDDEWARWADAIDAVEEIEKSLDAVAHT